MQGHDPKSTSGACMRQDSGRLSKIGFFQYACGIIREMYRHVIETDDIK